jgi:hypothetical protein
MWKSQIVLHPALITFHQCSCTLTSLPVFTIWKRHWCIVPCKSGTILPLLTFSIYYLLPITSKILPVPNIYVSNISRTSKFSALHHHRYIIWEKLMSVECVEVSNKHYSELHQQNSELPTFES